ncbi:MAG: hypothetical protein RMM06_04805 [Armatimonadota bacterium]|nr:hypothetical protein [bacterium]MCS7309093.1 hypothetical protein [Armatimonadota bacterium]MDW8105566.1 hypothetical protein [Armatimonadota bacterium]MDW8290019.1 hypothetical protein [Armatimonadota bacterium]
MQEIITAQQVDRVFLILAIVGPLVGAAVGWARGRRTLQGLLWGMLLTANWLLWRVYNAITDRLGLDTVRNLLVNLALFVTLGVVAGFLAAWRVKRGTTPHGTGAGRGQASPH